MTRDEIRRRLENQLSLEYGCRPEELAGDGIFLTLPAARPGRRIYTEEPAFFSMVTLGRGAVISADRRLHPFLETWIRDRRGFWLFEHDNLMELERELERYGKRLGQSHHMFLPRPEPLNFEPDFPLRWFTEEEIEPFYGDPRFPNAVCQPKDRNRPDVLAVAALADGEIAGLAVCSADCQGFWQIGIDVLPSYQGRGIGTALVGLLKDRVFREGAVPFYGTSLSNLHSWNIALNCGFYPAWVEIET